MRTLEVVKSRAQGAAPGRHPFEITPQGLVVWPLHDPAREPAEGAVCAATERLSTGLEGLDQLLCGGVFPGSLTLLAGMSGAGKTVLAAHFAAARAAAGGRVLFVSAGRGGPLPKENLSAIVPGFGDGLRGGAIAPVRVSLRDAAHPAEFLRAARAAAEAVRAGSLVLDALPLFPGEAGADMHLADFVLAPLAGLVAGTGGAVWITAHLGIPRNPGAFLATVTCPRILTPSCADRPREPAPAAGWSRWSRRRGAARRTSPGRWRSAPAACVWGEAGRAAACVLPGDFLRAVEDRLAEQARFLALLLRRLLAAGHGRRRGVVALHLRQGFAAHQLLQIDAVDRLAFDERRRHPFQDIAVVGQQLHRAPVRLVQETPYLVVDHARGRIAVALVRRAVVAPQKTGDAFESP